MSITHPPWKRSCPGGRGEAATTPPVLLGFGAGSVPSALGQLSHTSARAGWSPAQARLPADGEGLRSTISSASQYAQQGKCPSASAQGRPNLSTSLSLGTLPTATRTGNAANGTHGAESSAWDLPWPGPTRAGAAETPATGTRGGWGGGDTPLLSSFMGAAESAPNHCSTAQGLHPRTLSCDGLCTHGAGRTELYHPTLHETTSPHSPQGQMILPPWNFLTKSTNRGVDVVLQQLPAHPSHALAFTTHLRDRDLHPSRATSPTNPNPAEKPIHLPAGRAPPPAAVALVGLWGQKRGWLGQERQGCPPSSSC